MDQIPSKLICKTSYHHITMSYRVTIHDGNTMYTLGRYETAENANAARALAENTIRTAASTESMRKQLTELYRLSDIPMQKDYTGIPKVSAPGFAYQKATGCYYLKMRNKQDQNRLCNLGVYAPHELDVGRARVDYMSKLKAKSFQDGTVDRLSAIFCKIQRNERVSLDSLERRSRGTNGLILGICMTDDDGTILSSVNPRIDTILPRDFNRLKETDVEPYPYVILFNFDEHPYPQPAKIPDIARPDISDKKFMSVSNRNRKEDKSNGA